MAVQMFRGLRRIRDQEVPVTRSGPFTAGIVLSGSNPYFLVWWATVGLGTHHQRQRIRRVGFRAICPGALVLRSESG